MKKIVLFLCFVSLLFASPKGCYDIFKLKKKPPKEIETAFFILIDETTHFNKRLQEQILSNVSTFLKPSNYIYVAKFSAFVEGFYNEKVFDFYLDTPLNEDDRYHINKNTLAKIDKCLIDQRKYVASQTYHSIKSSFLKDDGDVPKSDILFALSDFGRNVISEVNAKQKIILLASDMLENSSITSFYTKGNARKIDPKKELKKVEKEDLFSDFGDSKVYVVGAGLINSNKQAYRNPSTLNMLQQFWMAYFKNSNAKLEEMGKPALKSLIQD